MEKCKALKMQSLDIDLGIIRRELYGLGNLNKLDRDVAVFDDKNQVCS